MDNFHKKHKKRILGSVDGMISNPGQLRGVKRVSTKVPSMSRNEDQHFAGRAKLDNFKLADGFHPAKQPKIEESSERIKLENEQVDHKKIGRNPNRHKDGKIDLSLIDGAEKPKKKRFRFSLKPTKRKFLVGFVVFALLVGGFFGNSWWKLNQVLKGGGSSAFLQDGIDPGKLNGEGDGRVNILLLGKGGDGHTAPDLTDTILIASIDPINKKAALLSIPRDLWVSPEGLGSMKVNAVYANAKSKILRGKKFDNQKEEADKAGFKAIEKEISKNMGIPIHYHVMVDFNGFEKAINTVGGIDINVKPENEVYEILWDDVGRKRYTLNVKAGPQHFDGRRALFYSRSRNTSPRGDFDRTERQRLVLQALKDKVLTAGTYSNPAKISGLLDTFGDHVQANMTVKELSRLYDIAKKMPNDGIASIGLADPPNNFVQTDSINGQSVVRPRAGIGNYTAIQNYVRNALKDGFIANENAKILILNGTSIEGLATKKSDELKSFGYNILSVGTAPTQTYTKTIIVDLRGGEKKYTKRYLENRFGITVMTNLPDNKIVPGEADFVIILGSNK